MPPISVSEGMELIELERIWREACRRSQWAGKVYFLVAACFLFGYGKFGYLVPIEKSPDYEIAIWLGSSALVLPLLACFCFCIWQEWQTYEKIAIFTCHPGATDGASLRERLRLFLEFVRAGRC